MRVEALQLTDEMFDDPPSNFPEVTFDSKHRIARMPVGPVDRAIPVGGWMVRFKDSFVVLYGEDHFRRRFENFDSIVKAAEGLGSWLAAALDDEKCCPEFKQAIREWFVAADVLAPTLE